MTSPTRRPAALLASALGGLLCLWGGAAAAQEPPREERALWVTRYDYRSAEDVRRVIRDAARLGMTRVLFQVRGNASTFYPSKLEPWSHRLGGRDPGFDPLGVACAEAAQAGLALEAWINVLPLWKGKEPPGDRNHPYRLHPEWVVVGSDGQPQRRSEHYVCANPALPAVRAHLAALAAELARGYPIDAVHLDYIRFVTDLEGKLDFGHDPHTLKAFGRDPAAEPAAWQAFKAGLITATVREIRAALRAARPSCRLTAAVFPTTASRAKVFQDPASWVEGGLVDALYPMTYATDPEEFAKRLRESLPLGQGKVPVYPGVAIRRHPDPAQTRRQIEGLRRAGAPGFALFCYSACFSSADQHELVTADAELRRRRVELLRQLPPSAPASKPAPSPGPSPDQAR